MGKNPYMKAPFPGFDDVKKLSDKEAGKKIKLLREAIEHHNYRYYIENEPAISDEKYDRLLDYLVDLEEEFPKFQSEDSPTRKIGAEPVDSIKKKKHPAQMLSLSSSTDTEKIRDFIDHVKKNTDGNKVYFILEPKFDGLSVEIAYRDGSFDYAATRGDGDTGDDISENVKTIGSLPLKLRKTEGLPGFLSLRGEIFIGKEGFLDLNRKRIERQEEPFANARNAAAGIVRQLDPKKVAEAPLDIFFYEILDQDSNGFESQRKMLEDFGKWGLKTNSETGSADDFEGIQDYFMKMGEHREKLTYEIDGIVIKLENRKLRSKLGTRQRSPRWAFAWKFEPRKEITALREIIVQVGRTGIITPVALLDPVDIGGVTVSRATLHNENEVKRKDVRPGDKVRVKRAGDVIPEIAERISQPGVKRGKPFEMPERCPICNARLTRVGAYVQCPAGLSCGAQLKRMLSHYASRGAMDIKYLGEEVVGQMVDKDLVKKFSDLYKLEQKDIEKLDGFAEKSAGKLYKSIRESRSAGLDRFLYALGIRHVGLHTARVIAQNFNAIQDMKQASVEDLKKIDEVGNETAESIHNFFKNEQNRQMLDDLISQGIDIHPVSGRKSGKLKGRTFVFTGELDEFTRDEAKRKVESLGGRVTSSVSSNTDYVVVGEGPGSKLDDARENEVKTIDESRFKELIMVFLL
ncbi:MAG: NAD-dependent DNA ligase LigA [Bacteroidales bacterium]